MSAPGGAQACGEDSDQFFRLRQNRVDRTGRIDEWKALSQSEPASRLFQFLKADAQFVSEIVARFGRLRLAVIWQGRGSGAQQLAGNVVSGSCFWQAFHQSNNPYRVIQQAIFQIERLHRSLNVES